ncbi:MAG: queuosine precursor transporter [Pseudomonadota bacterium]
MATSGIEAVLPLASSGSALQERRERVFLVLAGFFLCAMTLLNVIGITRFVQLGPMQIAVGVLAYPLTFLCTDLISELYGRARANFLVTVGLVLNGFILLIMSLANIMPAVDPIAQPPWQNIELANSISLPDGTVVEQSVELFSLIYACTAGAVFASMIAYIAAQYIDVYMFHWLKKRTNGKHLWLRNNGSTLISQAVDSIAVISITFGAAFLAGDMTLKVIIGLMLSNYVFKLLAALLDTPIIYLLVHKLRPYLQVGEHPHDLPRDTTP